MPARLPAQPLNHHTSPTHPPTPTPPTPQNEARSEAMFAQMLDRQFKDEAAEKMMSMVDECVGCNSSGWGGDCGERRSACGCCGTGALHACQRCPPVCCSPVPPGPCHPSLFHPPLSHPPASPVPAGRRTLCA